jgi:hypothetical protein
MRGSAVPKLVKVAETDLAQWRRLFVMLGHAECEGGGHVLGKRIYIELHAKLFHPQDFSGRLALTALPSNILRKTSIFREIIIIPVRGWRFEEDDPQLTFIDLHLLVGFPRG